MAGPAYRHFSSPVQSTTFNDLTVTGIPAGAVAAGTPVTLHVEYNKAMTAGEDYFGELKLGPPSAPDLMTVPITIHRQ